MAVLMAWIADLEEQLLILGVQHLSCPVCTAVYHNLAETDGCGVCMGEVTISALKEVRRRFPSASLYEFKQQVKRLGKGLSDTIEEPCWAGLGIDPSVFIKQDILHGLHKFIWDHPGEWLKKLIGENEMDCRFIAQPPIHTQRFTGSISKISQASRWEHCTYQRLMLPIIFGHEKVNAKVINAIWSVLDFVYMAQYPLLSDSNLSKMKDLLSSFNQNKEVFISNGSREPRHFASLNYMHCSTLSMMFTQEGLLKTAVLKHPSHYTFKCVRIHMRLPIIVTMTNKSSATLTYKIVYQCTLCMRITGRERGSR